MSRVKGALDSSSLPLWQEGKPFAAGGFAQALVEADEMLARGLPPSPEDRGGELERVG